MRQLTLIFVILLALLLPAAALADEPPVPEPPVWDKSTISVDAACVEGTPTFAILNGGSAMTGPISWYRLDVAGGASDCAEDVATGYLETGEVQLGEGEGITLAFEPVTPPMRLCVQQRPGHPGEGWASATITEETVKLCVTAEDVVEEPVFTWRWLFIPMAARE